MRPTTPDTQYVVPTISGDPAAAHRLATAYREVADAVAASQRRVAHIIGNLSAGWRGHGHRAIDAPVESFLHNARLLAHTLNEVAAELDAYGRQLAQAQRHHGISLHKLLKVGAVVAVSATAIVVTVGAAGVVEAAAASAAVGGAAEAAGAADIAAAASVDATCDWLDAIKPLLAFVVPHLVQAEWAAGAMATWDELTLDRLQWRSIAETGATALVASSAAQRGVKAVGEAGWARHVVQGTTWAGAAAGDDAMIEHQFRPLDVLEAFALAGGGTLARDGLRERGLWVEPPDYRREALVSLLRRPGHITDAQIAHELALLRQPAREIQRGEIDLRLHEGPGHTIERHTSKTAGELLGRLRADRGLRFASTYWDETTARESISRALATNQREITRWISTGCREPLHLRVAMPFDAGFGIDRHGTVRFIRAVKVILRRDSAGIVMVTSYPQPTR